MFGSRLTLFTLYGFTVRVDASWLLLAALIVWSLAAGYFPHAAPGLTEAMYWLMGVAGLVGLAASIIAHELAHALVARRQDMAIAGITLFVFGGIAEMEGEPPHPKGEFLMAVAGPAASVAIAAVVGQAAGLVAGPAAAVLGYVALINLLLAAFNMVPAFPLDGGRVLRAALWAWRGDVVWATRVASLSGVAIGIALMGLGLWEALAGNPVTGLWWGVIGFFVRMSAVQAWRQELARHT